MTEVVKFFFSRNMKIDNACLLSLQVADLQNSGPLYNEGMLRPQNCENR